MRLSRLAIGLSVSLHALAFCGLTRWAWRPTIRATEPQAVVAWLATPQAAPSPAESRDRPSPAEPSPSKDASRAQRDAVRAGRSVPASRSPPTEDTPSRPEANTPAPDFVEERRRAAADLLEDGARADSRRSFSFPGTIAQQRAFEESERFRRRERGLQPPLTVFDSPAKGRAALPEEQMVVYGVHWVSDDCYVFREPPDRFAVMGLLIPPVPPTTCPRRPARTDLFATAKPSYLMGDEERAAVDAETQRREHLRRPTTGAVMRLEKD